MVPSETSIAARELQRQDWLVYAERERLADLACAGKRCPEPHAALAAAMVALGRRLIGLLPPARRERPVAEAPAPVIAPGS